MGQHRGPDWEGFQSGPFYLKATCCDNPSPLGEGPG
jgi:hypothetical protein